METMKSIINHADKGWCKKIPWPEEILLNMQVQTGGLSPHSDISARGWFCCSFSSESCSTVTTVASASRRTKFGGSTVTVSFIFRWLQPTAALRTIGKSSPPIHLIVPPPLCPLNPLINFFHRWIMDPASKVQWMESLDPERLHRHNPTPHK